MKENIQLLYIDLFCGAGGTSTGVESAKWNGEKCAKVIACVNHDAKAIASHAANHPEALHFTEDIRTLELGPMVEHLKRKRKEYPSAPVVLWASLECTNFSKAKGGQPRDADSRTLAEHLFRYIEAICPDYIQIENVEEFMCWGDMDENGKPISKEKGKCYVRWCNKVRSYGYDFDYRILNAADYGAYTSRKRFFGIFARHGMPIVFPRQTHSKNTSKAEANLFIAEELKPWKAVREVLDFNDRGETIFREKALSENTLERIFAGLVKFVAGGKEAFLVKWNSMSKKGNYRAPGVDEPCPVVTTQNRLGMAQVSFLTSYYGNGGNRSVEEPAPTLTTKDRLAFIDMQYGNGTPSSIEQPSPAVTTNPKQNLVSCEHWIMNTNFKNVGSSIDEPAQTITANRKWHYLMNPQFRSAGGDIEKPCFTLIARMDKRPPYLVEADTEGELLPFIRQTENGLVYEIYDTDSPMTKQIKEFMAMYCIVNITMRMLRVNELKRIMGFPEYYVLVGTQTDQKKFIGNAVEVNMARVLCEAIVKKLISLKKNAA